MPDTSEHPLRMSIEKFWAPVPWMLEAAIVLELVLGKYVEAAVIAALRGLPDRQREALVLRYYADLSEAEIAATMGISRGAVKSHTSRAVSALRTALAQE